MTKNFEASQAEREIVFAILKQHAGDLLSNVSASDLDLKVKSRELTGVGAYINFDRDRTPILPETENRDLGLDGSVYVPGVPSGLGCVLAIEGGKLAYLELFTYGNEVWDGNLDGSAVSS